MRARPYQALIAVAALAFATTTIAQIEGGDRGVAPIDSSGDYEVTGVLVDVSAKTADEARYGGWREAQRKAWSQLSKRLGRGGGTLPDSALDSLVSAIVVENEQIGPNRYVARLGVLFDRDRASSVLGISSYISRSPPMVVIPVQWAGGTGQVFERRTEWQEAWARYRTGNSTIDYIRPTGTGPDPLLMNVGQIGRPGRGWWRAILDQYGGRDVVIPSVKLHRQWPGGPVIATFEARQGPDNRLLARFSLRVGSEAGLPALLDAGVQRIDAIYQAALSSGEIRNDPGLSYVPPSAPTPEAAPSEDISIAEIAPSVRTTQVAVQFDTPAVGAVTSTEASIRAIPGVTSATTSSLALGGVSIMTVSFGGSSEELRAALEARGWQVLGSEDTLRIRRAPRLLPPDIAPDNASAG